jgi:hypothetical protein
MKEEDKNPTIDVEADLEDGDIVDEIDEANTNSDVDANLVEVNDYIDDIKDNVDVELERNDINVENATAVPVDISDIVITDANNNTIKEVVVDVEEEETNIDGSKTINFEPKLVELSESNVLKTNTDSVDNDKIENDVGDEDENKEMLHETNDASNIHTSLQTLDITDELQPIDLDKSSSLEEVELDIDIDTNNLESDAEIVQLKKPNEVYYEIYREARRKAKQAKKAAIIAYLEAKNIKNTYMLDEIEDSSDDEEELEDLY